MAQLVPVNHSVADAHLAAGLSLDDLPPAPTADTLTNVEQENYELDLASSASAGFAVMSVSGAGKHQVLLHGTSRWLDVTTPVHTYRFGVAVRVIVSVTSMSGESSLSLPSIAAKVQLSEAFASAQLLVRGYKGTLAKALPSWDSFDVATFADYKSAVSMLEQTVFGDPANIVPELLATTVNGGADQAASSAPAALTAGASVGSVIALHAISRGFGLPHTLDHLHDKDPELVAAIRAVYGERIGDDLAAVTEEQKQAAHADLHGLDFAPEFLSRFPSLPHR